MKSMILPLFAVVVVVALAACSDSTKPAPAPPMVSGTVTDAAGDPVADAAIVLDLDIVVPTATFADKPRTMINFSLPEPTPYELTITDACDDEVYFTQTDSSAGSVSVVWDGTDEDGLEVPEGVYRYHLSVPDHETASAEIILARNTDGAVGDFGLATCAVVRQEWRVAAWTDGNGRYTVARDCWDFGRSIDSTDETGTVIGSVTVASRVRAWAYPADRDYGSPSGWVGFDAIAGARADVQVGPVRPPRR